MHRLPWITFPKNQLSSLHFKLLVKIYSFVGKRNNSTENVIELLKPSVPMHTFGSSTLVKFYVMYFYPKISSNF